MTDNDSPSTPSPSAYTSRKVIGAYLATNVLFVLAASMIWAINTVFLIRLGGLSIFQVMLVNASFTVSQMVFEVPTGVIADTIGRKASILLSMGTLIVSTVLYVLTPGMHWGIGGFFVASTLLGLGFTFQTGAIDAWMVDALDASGWTAPKDRVFAWGQIAFGAGMLVGSIVGGFLGQANLTWPFIARAVLLFGSFAIVLIFVRDAGFEPRPLKASNFAAETRVIFDVGVRYGWRNRVIRPLLFVSALSGLFFMYGFYAWQPYVLTLLGRDYVWLLGVVQAGSSAAGILGNLVVSRVMRSGDARRDPARVLFWFAVVEAVLVAGIGAVGLVRRNPGVLPAAAAIALWLLWGVTYGVAGPVRMSYINEHIPSAQRATVLSLDAFFADGGGALGQPALGWISQKASISIAWLVGSVALGLSAPFYRLSGDAAEKERRAGD